MFLLGRNSILSGGLVFSVEVGVKTWYTKSGQVGIAREGWTDAHAEAAIGIENFKEMRKQDFYYVDKTGLIVDLLADWGKVNLFTRPRRFGKTLNMSMLANFFEIGADASLFDGLRVSEEKELWRKLSGEIPRGFRVAQGRGRADV